MHGCRKISGAGPKLVELRAARRSFHGASSTVRHRETSASRRIARRVSIRCRKFKGLPRGAARAASVAPKRESTASKLIARARARRRSRSSYRRSSTGFEAREASQGDERHASEYQGQSSPAFLEKDESGASYSPARIERELRSVDPCPKKQIERAEKKIPCRINVPGAYP